MGRRIVSRSRIVAAFLMILLLLTGSGVSANIPPVADAEPDYQEVFVGEAAHFYGNMSYDPDGWIVYYHWDFGDGSSDGGNQTYYTYHVYSAPGLYEVILTVYDNEMTSDNDTVYVNVLQLGPTDLPPNIEVLEPGGTPGQMYYQGDIIEILWNATDDSPLPTNPINITYGETTIGWIPIASDEPNDGIYLWDTANVPCPGAYWVRIGVYDSVGQTSWDTSDYHFYFLCRVDEPPSITVFEPGGTPGQTYTQGDIIEVTWFAADDNPLPFTPINITYGDPLDVWTTVATNEPNDGTYDWDTTGEPPGSYWMRLSVYDSNGHTSYDLSNFSFEITCLDCPPGAPELLSAVLTGADNKDVTINWALSADDGSGEDDIASYEIYYGTEYANDGAGYVLLDSVPAGTDTYVHDSAGDGDLNNYFYFVQVIDSIGQASWEGQAGKYVRALNGKLKELVSIPLVQQDTSILEVLKTIEGSYQIVHYYKSSDQSDHWKSFKPDKPWQHNDLLYIDHKIAFWIKMLSDDDLAVAGLVPEITILALEPSWNFIGYPSFTPRTVADALSAITYTKVEGWTDMPPFHLKIMSDSDMMSDGNGYWVRVHSTQALTILN